MKTAFSTREYKTLMELVFMGNWVANAYSTEPLKEYDDLEQAVFENAEEYGQGELISGSNPSQKFLDIVLKKIFEYNECLFWEELADRLAERDLERQYGEELKSISSDELIEKGDELKGKYLEIFSKSGLNVIDVAGNDR